MSKRPAPTFLDFGFKSTSKHARVISPSAEVDDQPDQDPEDYSEALDLSSYSGPGETAGYVTWCG